MKPDLGNVLNLFHILAIVLFFMNITLSKNLGEVRKSVEAILIHSRLTLDVHFGIVTLCTLKY